ncbi:hypothetical protein [Sorangium sp. So ce426]|uniref:hypothetical protein n=1 Tax=unclassified Sorangium TaxID=2621164 RepID=UPI003F5C9FB1
MHAYDQTRRAIAYLRWNEGDADTIAPSLYKGRGGRAASSSDTAEAPEDGAPAGPPASPGAAPPVVPRDTAAPAVSGAAPPGAAVSGPAPNGASPVA